MRQIELNQLISLEKQVWDALIDGNAQADADLLSDSFLGVYKSGFARKSEHSGQLENGPTILRYQIEQPEMMLMSEDCVMLSYLAHYVRVQRPERKERMYVSSVWRKTKNRWLNIFSQDTDAE